MIIFFDQNVENINAYKNVLGEIADFGFVTDDFEDILDKYKMHAVVSPANSYGMMTGGIDRTYTKFFSNVENTVKERISSFNLKTKMKKNYIPVGSAVMVKTGDDRCKFLICAPTMFMPDAINDTENVYYCFIGILHLLKHYDSFLKVVVMCPCLVTGIGEMEADKSAEEIKRAYNDFNNGNLGKIYENNVVSDNSKSFVLKKFPCKQPNEYCNKYL